MERSGVDKVVSDMSEWANGKEVLSAIKKKMGIDLLTYNLLISKR